MGPAFSKRSILRPPKGTLKPSRVARFPSSNGHNFRPVPALDEVATISHNDPIVSVVIEIGVRLASLRFIRLLLACLFVVTASADAVAAVFDLCGNAHAQTSNEHRHADTTAHQDTADDAGVVVTSTIDDMVPSNDTKSDGVNQGLVSTCHSNAAGCPGCIAPADMALAMPGSDSIVFPHLSVSGDSADLHGDLRPPKLS